MSLGNNSIDDIFLRVLSELGLNEYETKAYLTILEGGVVVAREISDRSGIPYAKVYQVLDSLVQKSMIIGDESRPKKFRAKEPKEAFYDRLSNLENDWKKQQSIRKELIRTTLPDLENLFHNSNVDVEEEQGVWNITGLANILSRISKLMILSNNQILITMGNTHLLTEKLLKSIEDIQKPLKIIIRSKSQNKELSKIGKVYISEELGEMTSLIFDEIAMIDVIETNRGKFASGEYTAVLTQISPIVKSNIIDFFNLIGEKNE